MLPTNTLTTRLAFQLHRQYPLLTSGHRVNPRRHGLVACWPLLKRSGSELAYSWRREWMPLWSMAHRQEPLQSGQFCLQKWWEEIWGMSWQAAKSSSTQIKVLGATGSQWWFTSPPTCLPRSCFPRQAGLTHTHVAFVLKVLLKGFTHESCSCYVGNPCAFVTVEFLLAIISRKLDIINYYKFTIRCIVQCNSLQECFLWCCEYQVPGPACRMRRASIGSSLSSRASKGEASQQPNTMVLTPILGPAAGTALLTKQKLPNQ